MFRGYPEVKVQTQPDEEINAEVLQDAEDGPVHQCQFPAIDDVTIDAHVLLRVSKHARDMAPRPVFGRLAGLQLGTTVEVTGVLPTAPPAPFTTPEQRDEQDQEDLQKLTDHLSKEGFDTTLVGRYSCAGFGTTVNAWQLSQLVKQMQAGEPALLLAYDPQRTKMGKLHLRALVPTPAFYKMFPPTEAGADALANAADVSELGVDGVLREVPVSIRASPLQQLLLEQLAAEPRGVTNELLKGSALGTYTERSLQQLIEYADRLKQDLINRNVMDVSLRQETQLTAQQVREQARHVAALSAGSALNLDFAAKMPQ